MARRKRTITQRINSSLPSLGKDFYAMLLPALLETFNAVAPKFVNDQTDIIKDNFDSVMMAPIREIQDADSLDDEKEKDTRLETTLRKFGAPPHGAPNQDELLDETVGALPGEDDTAEDTPDAILSPDDNRLRFRFISGDTVSPAFEPDVPPSAAQKKARSQRNAAPTEGNSDAPTEKKEGTKNTDKQLPAQDAPKGVNHTKPQKSDILDTTAQEGEKKAPEKPFTPLTTPEGEESQGSITPGDPEKSASGEVEQEEEEETDEELQPSGDNTLTVDDQSKQRTDRINSLVQALEQSDKDFADKVKARIAPLQAQVTKLKQTRSAARGKKAKEQVKLAAAMIRYVIYNAIGALLIIIGVPLLFIIAGTVLVIPGIDLIVQAQVRIGPIMAKCTAVIHTLNMEIKKLNKVIKELEKQVQTIQVAMNREYQPARNTITEQLDQLMAEQQANPQTT